MEWNGLITLLLGRASVAAPKMKRGPRQIAPKKQALIRQAKMTKVCYLILYSRVRGIIFFRFTFSCGMVILTG